MQCQTMIIYSAVEENFVCRGNHRECIQSCILSHFFYHKRRLLHFVNFVHIARYQLSGRPRGYTL